LKGVIIPTGNSQEIVSRKAPVLSKRASTQIESLLQQDGAIRQLAQKHAPAKDFYFLSRGYMCSIAPQQALKLREVSYIVSVRPVRMPRA
jgi:glucosamine 6-phosphate synthetase-like amidotransferase/phosphosugar isomerase protein